MPHSPLGSAAVTAMLASIGLSSSCFHSSGVKLVLFATVVPSLCTPSRVVRDSRDRKITPWHAHDLRRPSDRTSPE
jgi:hypothetical protein